MTATNPHVFRGIVELAVQNCDDVIELEVLTGIRES